MTSAGTAAPSPLRGMIELGTEFWNDSCALRELQEAVARGATGATSNPVIVASAVEADPERWLPVLRGLVRARPRATEDGTAWELIEALARAAARVLEPIHRASAGERGRLCVQVDPRLHRDARAMLAHALRLSSLAPNVAIKVPATQAGLQVLEELSAEGIAVNATVCFTVSQAAACAEAVERGRRRGGRLAPAYVTLMVGRLDDHLKRLAERDRPAVDPAFPDWAGIAVFKRARGVFQERGFASRLLVAAYRHERHWSQLIGPGIVQSIPYAWWTRFDASGLRPSPTLDAPVDPEVVSGLRRAFPDFRRAYERRGLEPGEFAGYGASLHTLEQFISGYRRVVESTRAEMFKSEPKP
ncbi:MAG: transaldolase family protein [Elusimicrobia bacterium]|nr:transaldolase family protein [Elusimicrobiota bacterium]